MDMIEKYISEMEANGRSGNTVRIYRIILEKLNDFKPLNKITKEDLIKFFKELQGSDATKSLHQVIIKKYFKDIGKRPLVEWIKIIRPKETLHPDDIPTASEINKMIEATDSYYFKALIAFLFEGGPRISEASGGKSGEEKKRLRYRDFVDTVDGMIVQIPTKKTHAGYRPVILSPQASQHIKNLKLYTYAKDDDEVFTYANEWMNQELKKIAKMAGINKRVTCHILRHAAATQDARNGMNEENLRRKYGWSPGSKMPSRYTNLNTQDVIKAQLRAKGITPEVTEPSTEKLKEPPKLSIADGASMLFKLQEDLAEEHSVNEELKKELEVQKKKNEEMHADVESLKSRFLYVDHYVHSYAYTVGLVMQNLIPPEAEKESNVREIP